MRRWVVPVGAFGSALLTAGGYCYERLPRGTWMDQAPVLWSVRHAPHHLAWGLGLSAAGLVLLTASWWSLRAGVRGDPAGLRRVVRAVAAWTLPLLVAPPLFSGDGWSYVATGALTGRGWSPYAWTPAALPVPLRSGVAPVWRFTPSPYGPLGLAWGGAFAHVTRDPWLLLACYRGFALLGLGLLVWAVPVLAARAGKDPVDATVLGAASPFVLAHGVGGLHNDLVVAGVAATALALTGRGRWRVGAVLVGVAAAVKAPGAFAAVGVVLLSVEAEASWWQRLRRAGEVGGVGVGVVLSTGWLTGLGTGWIGALSVPDHEHTALSLTSLAGRWVRRLLEQPGGYGVQLAHDIHPELLAKRLGLVALVLLAAWVVLRPGPRDDRAALTRAAAVLVAAVALSPVVHYWYLLWGLALVPCVPLARATGAAVTAAITTLGLTAPADKALGIRWLWEGAAWALVVVPLLAWLATAALRARHGPSREDDSRASRVTHAS